MPAPGGTTRPDWAIMMATYPENGSTGSRDRSGRNATDEAGAVPFWRTADAAFQVVKSITVPAGKVISTAFGDTTGRRTIV